MDGASNVKWSGTGIVLEGFGDIVIEHALMFKFTSSNNQVEYEALLTDMIFALEMEVIRLTKSDSHLVTK